MSDDVLHFTHLSKTLGKCTSMADSPCIGICTVTQWGDDRGKGCGRTALEIRQWGKYSDIEKKLINLRNANEKYAIRQLKTGNRTQRTEKPSTAI